jgi:hypothetical protein
MAIAGPGVGLPYPTNPYPAQPAVPGVSSSVWTNEFYIGRATLWQIPPGWWSIKCAAHTYVVYRDPVSQTLIPMCALGAYATINSDGTNFYVFNASGTPVQEATITAAGTTYTVAGTTIVPSAGGSTWLPIIDGTVTSFTVGNDKFGNAGGTNFTIPPIVVVQSPPSPGIQCTGLAVLSAGAVASITVEAGGAGYGKQAPGVFLIPDPTDPNIGSITIPAVTAVLASAVGAITGILQTYHGTSQSSVTLTINGGDSTATATVAVVTTPGDDLVTVTWLGSGA